MLQNGYTQKDIAQVINKDKSVVSREISRNADKRNGQYNVSFSINCTINQSILLQEPVN